MQRGYYLYIMTNFTNKVLYVGITSNLLRRIWEHKNKLVPGFTEKYNLNKLVYFQELEIHSMWQARIKEKQIKKWNRAWKIRIINNYNPKWKDLYPDLFTIFK